jgi:heavy metal translocating P-type ATPase
VSDPHDVRSSSGTLMPGGDRARHGAHVPHGATVQLALTVAGLASGGGCRLAGAGHLADILWAATAVGSIVPAATSVVRSLLRRRAGVDIIAMMALLGAVVVGEYLAGAVIALMLATGTALEARASARARRELTALLQRAPTVVRRVEAGALVPVAIDEVRPADLLLVGPGEVVPVDGTVVGAVAELDESALTGEAALVQRAAGDAVASGGVNTGGAFRLRATAAAAESTYAGIIRLVRQAQESHAPLTRVADRFALWFVPLTLGLAAVAGVVARDPVRAVAVLVVATPCPLILAAPVALVGGMSRAARRGIIVKGGAALEALGRADVLLFDKTGTLTAGRARVADVETGDGTDSRQVLRLAASLDQVSTHAFAAPIMQAAAELGLQLTLPSEVHEDAGKGVRGLVDGRRVMVGRASYVAGNGAVPSWAQRVRRRTAYEGLANVYVSVDGTIVGAMILEDPLRHDAVRAVHRLREAGIRRLVMVTGDHDELAQAVGSAVGVDAVYAERSPAGKVEVVREERVAGTVIMVGDGVNDAPALAAADVGVAMGARGATASSEAADVVLTVDHIDRVAEAVQIARRSHRIALQSIAVGMGLSLLAMCVAAAGYLAPVVGAVVQEVIDVAVIANALRAHRSPHGQTTPTSAVLAGQAVLDEHATMRSGTADLRRLADELGRVPPAIARADLEKTRAFIAAELLPHEADEDARLYPQLAPYIGGEDAVVAASREHAVVRVLARQFNGLVDALEPGGPTGEELVGLRRVLYSLHAVLTLHRAGEEERLERVVNEAPEVPRRSAG